MKVIGTGVGRTGTHSLKTALDTLGLGPTHHMDQVILDFDRHVPLWTAAVEGQPHWPTIYQGYHSAVDWPTACFYRELYAAYPDAKFVLTHRSPESWVASFGSTIYTLLGKRDEAPTEMQDWLTMCVRVLEKTGFPLGMDDDQLGEAFIAHNERVKAAIPPESLLIYEVAQGWEPLCDFLNVPAPTSEFPKTNDRIEFWDRVRGDA